MPPRVSVVIPLYNPGRLLRVCLDSTLNQDYPDLEIIPVDDAGAEPLRETLESYAARDPRIKPVFHSKNQGLAASLNDGIGQATGTYILVLEQDCELVDAAALSRAVDLAVQNPRTCVGGARRLPFAEMSAVEVAFALIRGHLPDTPTAQPVPAPFTELKCDLLPRAALEAAGGFDESFRFSGEDQVMSHRLREQGFAIVKAGALAFVLRSGDRVSARANLAREFTYGRTQAGILLSTAFGALGSSTAARGGRHRLSNRALSVVSGGMLLLALPVALVGGPSPWLFLLAAPAVARLAWVGTRMRGIWRQARNPARVTATAMALSPVDDLVYTVAFAWGLAVFSATRRA